MTSRALLLLLLQLALASWEPQDEREYLHLYHATKDKDALEAIRDLHRQLDDDKDGAIEPSETGDFIRADLQYGSDGQRQRNFHGVDQEITVKELWVSWHGSEVFSWTVDQVVDWLTNVVELPQYNSNFRRAEVNGSQLPRAAVSSSYLHRALGVTNPIHRSKIHLKAMDAVLFGAPSDPGNKDMVLTGLLVVAVSGLLYAHRQNKRSQEHLQRMMQDMDGLAKAEQALLELQEVLQQKDIRPDNEVIRLKEELDVLRSELSRAEVELEDKCWGVAPPLLQHWLQITYEVETATYNRKRKSAEEQMELAKNMCERLKRKRSSLVGAIVSAHGRSMDDVDRYILEARTALVDVTKDLAERTKRWRQIELLCGCSVVSNPGVPGLQNLLRRVNFVASSSRLSRDAFNDEGDATPASSALTSPLNSSQNQKSYSSSTEELVPSYSPQQEQQPRASKKKYEGGVATTPPAAGSVNLKASKRMVKSHSQDAGGTIQKAAAFSAASRSWHGHSSFYIPLTSSVSEGHLQMQRVSRNLSLSVLNQPQVSLASAAAEDESDSASVTDRDGKKRKLRNFFSFKGKKEKKDAT